MRFQSGQVAMSGREIHSIKTVSAHLLALGVQEHDVTGKHGKKLPSLKHS